MVFSAAEAFGMVFRGEQRGRSSNPLRCDQVLSGIHVAAPSMALPPLAVFAHGGPVGRDGTVKVRPWGMPNL